MSAAGVTAVELLVTVTLVGLLCIVAAPRLADWAGDRRLRASVTELRVAVAGARAAAAAGRGRAIVFEEVGERLRWAVVADGDGDGVRSSDLRSGRDPRVLGPVVVPERHRGVTGGIPPGAAPLGATAGVGGVAFGRSRSVACRPDGGCSSGTLYLRGGRGRGVALRVYGPTGRIRIYEWRPDGVGWRSLP